MPPALRVYRILVAVCAVAALSCAALALAYQNQGTFSPWEQVSAFHFPYLTSVDSQGRSYVVDSATRRLVALNRDGTLRWIKEGGSRGEGFYYAHGLAVDRQNRLYLYNWVPFPGADYIAQQIEIQRYSAEGVFEKTVFKLTNDNRDEAFPGYFSLQIEDDQLVTIYGNGTDLVVRRSGLGGEAPTVLRQLPSESDFVALAARSSGLMVGAARDGVLWEALPGQSWKRLEWPGLSKPWDLHFAPDGSLVVLDVLRGELQQRLPDGRFVPLLSTSQTGGVFADTFSVTPTGGVAVADKDKQRLLIFEKGQGLKAFAGAELSVADQSQRWLFWGGAGGCLALVLASLVLTYFFVVNRRLPLLFIQLTVFVPLIILAQVLAISRLYDSMFLRYQDQVRKTLLTAADLTSKLLPGRAVAALNKPSDLNSPEYGQLKVVAKSLQKAGQESGGFSYIAVYRRVGGLPHYVFTASGTFGVDYPYTLLPREAQALFDHSGVVFAQYSDDYGVYDAAFSSLLGSDGKPVAVIEVGLFADLVKEMERTSLETAERTALVSGALFVVVFIILTLMLLRSLSVLRKMTHEIASGRLEGIPVLPHRDEIGQLSRDFETMSGRLKGYLTQITAETAASARFVPQGLIGLLGDQDLTELQLGAQTSREMTILFSTLQNFRRITGEMSPQGVFKALNSYLASTAPLIQAHHGVIDKYIGDTYMALFPRLPADALDAWREIHRKMAAHNAKRVRSGSEGFSLSFGIHYGSLMLGIVGEHERLDGTVIADAVNLTSRLNGLARIYGVSCVVSESTLLRMPDPPPFRALDHVIVKGKSEPLLVCQPLDPEDASARNVLARLHDYKSAFGAWEKGHLEEALKRFEELEYRIPEDPVVKRHAARCRELSKTGLPSPWSPAVKIQEK